MTETYVTNTRILESLKKMINECKDQNQIKLILIFFDMFDFEDVFMDNMSNIIYSNSLSLEEKLLLISKYYESIYINNDKESLLINEQKLERESFEMERLKNICANNKEFFDESTSHEEHFINLNFKSIESKSLSISDTIFIHCMMYKFSTFNNVENCDFIDCILDWTDFSNKKFTNCNFYNCSIQFGNFSNCNLENSVFYDCNFDFSKFDNTNMKKVAILDCDMNYVKMENIDFKSMCNFNYRLLNKHVPDIEIPEENTPKNKIFTSPLWSKQVGLYD